MKKIYFFLASLLAFGSLQADVFTPQEGKVYYIQSTRSGRFVKVPETNGNLLQVTGPKTSDTKLRFQFESVAGKENTWYIKNVGLDGYLNSDISNVIDKKESAEGTKTEWVIDAHESVAGAYSICPAGSSNGWNEEASERVVSYGKTDTGCAWKFLTEEEIAEEHFFSASKGEAYFIKNDRNHNGKAYVSTRETGNFVRVPMGEMFTDEARFFFEQVDGDVCYYIKNGAGKYINQVGSGEGNFVDNSSDAQKWYVFKSPWVEGAYVIAKADESSKDSWHPTNGGEVMTYSFTDEASCWYLESLGDVLKDAKTTHQTLANDLSVAVRNNYAFLPEKADELLDELNGLLAGAEDTDAEKIAKIQALQAFDAKYSGTERVFPADGTYRLVCIFNKPASGYRGDVRLAAQPGHGMKGLNSENAGRALWNITFDKENKTCKLQNYLTKEYATFSGGVKLTSGETSLNYYTYSGSVAGMFAFGTSEGSCIHLQGNTLNAVSWSGSEEPSQYVLMAVENPDAQEIIDAEQALADAEVNNAVASLAEMLGVSASSVNATSLNDYLDGTEAIYSKVYQNVEGKIYRFYSPTLNRNLAFNSDNALYFEETDRNVLNQLWTLVPVGDGFKLKNLNLGKCADNLKNAAGNSDQNTYFVDDEAGAGVYHITDVNGSGFLIKNDGHVMRKESGFIVNWWSGEQDFRMTVALVESVDINLNYDLTIESYATAYLPFAVSSVEGAKAYTASAPANGQMVLTEASAVAAETGIVLISDEGNATAKLTIGESADAATESALRGTTVAMPVEAGSVLTLGMGDRTNEVGFFTYSGTSLRANSAYLPAAEAGASALVFSFGGDTDGVQGIEAAATARDGKVYDLSGRRVGKAGKGIYIVNGKKMIK